MTRRILVAEDSPTQAELLRQVLEETGYKPFALEEVRRAVQRAIQER